MTHVVKVARNGAITIPAEIRRKYGIADGSYLGIEEAGENIRLVKIRLEKESFIKAADEMARIAEKKGVSRKDVVKASRKAGKEVYAAEYGE